MLLYRISIATSGSSTAFRAPPGDFPSSIKLCPQVAKAQSGHSGRSSHPRRSHWATSDLHLLPICTVRLRRIVRFFSVLLTVSFDLSSTFGTSRGRLLDAYMLVRLAGVKKEKQVCCWLTTSKGTSTTAYFCTRKAVLHTYTSRVYSFLSVFHFISWRPYVAELQKLLLVLVRDLFVEIPTESCLIRGTRRKS